MKIFLISLLLMLSFNSYAGWLNLSGKVENIATYSGSETILITLDSPGAPVVDCANQGSFAISKNMSSEARARMYSMFLTAKASGKSVIVTYNDVGSCEPWDANQNAYRQIVRVTL